MKKFLIGGLALVFALSSVGCVASWYARKGTPQTRYYAALNDYNAAKSAAVIAVANPAVPIPLAEKIQQAVHEGDAQVASIEDMRQRGVFDGDLADIAVKVLLEIQKALAKLVVEAATVSSSNQAPLGLEFAEVAV